ERVEKAGQLERARDPARHRHRREAPAKSLEGKAVDLEIGVETEQRAAGVESSLTTERAGRPLSVAVIEPAGKGDVLPRSLERPGELHPTVERDRRRDEPDGPEIEIGADDPGPVERHPVVAAQ